MRAVTTVSYFLLGFAIAASTMAAAQDAFGDADPFWDMHDACYRPTVSSWNGFHVRVNDTSTKVSQFHWEPEWNQAVDDVVVYFPKLIAPTNSSETPVPWPEGVQFAAQMQAANLFPTTDTVVSATWSRRAYRREDTLAFTTSEGETFTFASTLCMNWNMNCGYQRRCYYGGPRGGESCCGYNTGTPRCIPVNSGRTCCEISDESAVCNVGDTCCAQGYVSGDRPRARCCNSSSTCCTSGQGHKECCGQGSTCCSSSWQAKCCEAGSTCCKSAEYTATCCPASTTCCSGTSGLAICCNSTQYCDLVNYRCSPITTSAPTVAPPQDPNAVHRACLSFSMSSAGSIYYDVRTGPSGTTLHRWSNGHMIDSNRYATLHMPAPGTVTWDEGVGYAATMQTRNAWVNSEPTQAATWEVVNGEDVWRFSTTINGSPVQLVFRSSNCP